MAEEMPFTLNRLGAIKARALGTGRQIVACPTMEYHSAARRSEAVVSGLIWGDSQDLLSMEKKEKQNELYSSLWGAGRDHTAVCIAVSLGTQKTLGIVRPWRERM